MKTTKLTLGVVLLSFLLLSLSCKKRKPLDEEIKNPPPEEPQAAIFLPILLESKDLRLRLSYEGAHHLLTRIDRGNQDYIEISYRENLPLKASFYSQEKATGFLDFISNKEKIVNINSWLETGKVNSFMGNHTLSYDPDGRIAELHYYGVDRLLFKQSELVYTQDNNIHEFKTEELTGTVSRKVQYTYDERNGIFKNIPFIEVLFRELGIEFCYPGKHNVLQAKVEHHSAEDLSFHYQYNAQGYPTELTMTRNQLKEIYQISYKEIEP